MNKNNRNKLVPGLDSLENRELLAVSPVLSVTSAQIQIDSRRMVKVNENFTSLTTSGVSSSTPKITAISAGSARSNSALFWIRGYNATQTGQTPLGGVRLMLSTSPDFNQIRSINGLQTLANRDFTAKKVVAGLKPSTTYYYKYQVGGITSEVGQITTAPDSRTRAAVRFGFSGCADGRFRPFSSLADIAQRKLNFFIILGDLAYSRASKDSPKVGPPYPVSNIETSIQGYRRKYAEAIDPKYGDLAPLYRSQGIYSAFDNQELADGAYETGGADPKALRDYLKDLEGTDDPDLFVNRGRNFVNKTAGFRALTRTWSDYVPERSQGLVENRSDPRSDGTRRFFYKQTWGRNMDLFNLDDRSYRDAKLVNSSTGNDITNLNLKGADTPGRSILGRTQMKWLKNSLLESERKGVVWKVISISSPIDIMGPPGAADGPPQLELDAKQWWGNYRQERNELLKFIADNKIKNVLFLSTDDHEFRANELTYSPSGAWADPSSYKVLPGAFSIVTSPIGAGRPSGFVNQDLVATSQAYQNSFIENDLNPIGLEQGLFKITSLNRSQIAGYQSDLSHPQLLDFWSPESFNYTQIDINQSGQLHIEVRGIPGYDSNSEVNKPTGPADAVRSYVTFSVDPIAKA
jgi:phosphodiesterase/alkaline phosphatase D-like protein